MPGPANVAERAANALLISKVDRVIAGKHAPAATVLQATDKVLADADKSLDNFASFEDENQHSALIPRDIVHVVSAEEK